MSGWQDSESNRIVRSTRGPLEVYETASSRGYWHWRINGMTCASGGFAARDLGTAKRLATQAAHTALDSIRSILPPLTEE